jgi:hypothetical protein
VLSDPRASLRLVQTSRWASGRSGMLWWARRAAPAPAIETALPCRACAWWGCVAPPSRPMRSRLLCDRVLHGLGEVSCEFQPLRTLAVNASSVPVASFDCQSMHTSVVTMGVLSACFVSTVKQYGGASMRLRASADAREYCSKSYTLTVRALFSTYLTGRYYAITMR